MTIETLPKTTAIIYPESDGKPMANNTKQFRWIVTIQGGLDVLFQDDPNIFVAGDLLWYPVEGNPNICQAPNALVVFGRPKCDRGSYLQWCEDNIAPQVVFEVMSSHNTIFEMVRKLRFYEQYGVEEYYIYDLDRGDLSGWLRSGDKLIEIETLPGWTSPRLGVRFELHQGDLQIYRPDGQRFASYLELEQQCTQALQQVENERRQREEAQARAENERRQREEAQARAENERRQAATGRSGTSSVQRSPSPRRSGTSSTRSPRRSPVRRGPGSR